MFRHIGAAVVALGLSIRYQIHFGIKLREAKRYWLKAINLALCYQGFATDQKAATWIGAGKAAFFCCVYDVITDWRGFDQHLFRRFESLTKQMLSKEAAELAICLYQKEKCNLLEEGGISRGSIALEFVTKIMGSEVLLRRKTNFETFGLVMQIVDDVLDIEEDRREHKMNSLLCRRRDEFLILLIEFPIEQVKMILPRGLILWKVVDFAREKAKRMMLF